MLETTSQRPPAGNPSRNHGVKPTAWFAVDTHRGRRLLAAMFAILLVAAIAVAIKLSGSMFAPGGGQGFPPPPVRLVAVRYEPFADLLEALGTAKARESVRVTAKVTETVRSLYFEDGGTVKKGDRLAELTDAEQAAELEQARAALTEAEQQFDRTADLVEKGIQSRALLDTARGTRDAAAGRVSAIEARLGDRLILAPFDGVLGLRAVSPGTLLRPGDTIVTLDDISLIKVDFSIPETFLAALASGQVIEAKSAAYPAVTFKGIVRTIDTRIDPVTRSVMVRAEIDNPEELLRPGMLMSVDLVKNRRRSLMVPEQVLIPLGDRQYVMVVEDGIAKRREITVGQRMNGAVEILAGLSEGERVVAEGTHRASDGQPVNVIGEIDGASS